MRANDPLYEIAMMLGGHRKEDQFWEHTLTALGRYLGAPPAPVVTRVVCVDPRRQWRYAGSLWQNSLRRRAAPRSAARASRPDPAPQPRSRPAPAPQPPSGPGEPAGQQAAGRPEPRARG